MGLFEISGFSGVQTMIRISTKIGWTPFWPITYSPKKNRNDTSQTVGAGLLTNIQDRQTDRQTDIQTDRPTYFQKMKFSESNNTKNSLGVKWSHFA